MKVEDFDYNLPEELIAQTPLEKRDASRLLLLDKNTGEIAHSHFFHLPDYLKKDDILVLNDTKVLPARLIGTKVATNATIELLLLKDLGNNIWECLSKPAKRLQEGTVISFGDGRLKAIVKEKLAEGIVHVEMAYTGIFLEVLEALGTMPLPPYIHEKLKDGNRYQTVYAKEIGSAAAPTAGLHFTKELLAEIARKGVKILYVTLHVGLGTFRPVEVENIQDHHMHSEYYIMDSLTAATLNQAKENHQRIVAVGTTTTRVLETIATNNNGHFVACSGNTDIFIYPGYQFKGIDCLITNFHLPKSTLVMLVSALAGKDHILNAYQIAVQEKYRFFSFGDAMFITDDITKKENI